MTEQQGVAPEIVAVIAVAVDAVWPRAVVADVRALRVPDEIEIPSWRFSGRSWAKHVASRRDRP